jgi:hypothetical protein
MSTCGSRVFCITKLFVGVAVCFYCPAIHGPDLTLEMAVGARAYAQLRECLVSFGAAPHGDLISVQPSLHVTLTG